MSDDESGTVTPATPSRGGRIAASGGGLRTRQVWVDAAAVAREKGVHNLGRGVYQRRTGVCWIGPWCLAVRLRDADAVDRLLAAGADALAPVSASSPETALWKSCAAPDLATLRALVAHAGDGFDVNVAHGVVRATPLCVLAASGDADACAILLDAGADASIRDARGRGPLWHAAHRGHGNVIRCLATRLENERGADVVRSVVDARDCDGITPLHAAARVGAQGPRSPLSWRPAPTPR